MTRVNYSQLNNCPHTAFPSGYGRSFGRAFLHGLFDFTIGAIASKMFCNTLNFIPFYSFNNMCSNIFNITNTFTSNVDTGSVFNNSISLNSYGSCFDTFVPQSSTTYNLGNYMLCNQPMYGMYSNITNYQTTSPTGKSKSTKHTSNETVSDGTSITVQGLNYSACGNFAGDVKKLRPKMQEKVVKLFEYANQKGLKLTISSGFRTQAEQKALQDNPKTQKFAAKGNTSRHLYGCAIDIKINGVKSGDNFNEIGKYAESIGLRWGRHFSTREDWHFDLDPSTTPKAQKTSVA